MSKVSYRVMKDGKIKEVKEKDVIEVKKMRGVPVKAVHGKSNGMRVNGATLRTERIKRRKFINGLISSMNLDEMLQASKIVEMGLRGEKIPAVKSSKVRQYVGTVLKVNEKDSTRAEARKIQDDLVVQIVEKNKKTVNGSNAKYLYDKLMKDQ